MHVCFRAMQTAVGVFGCEDHMNVYGLDKCKPPVTVANDLNAKPALNCCSCPALLAFEKCRDRMVRLLTLFSTVIFILDRLKYDFSSDAFPNLRAFVHLIRGEALANINLFFPRWTFHW